jgi:arylformamidase
MHRVLYDITRPVYVGVPVWPGDADFQLDWTRRIRDGASVNLSELRLSTHTGTHADAPFHAADDGSPVGELPLAPFVGDALLLGVEGWPKISADRLRPLLARQPCARLLYRTGCWTEPNRFPDRVPALEPAAVELLAERGVSLVGTDAPSVDPLDSKDLPAHHALRAAGMQNLESLLLDDVPPGRYTLIALPLRLLEAEASPIRAVLCAADE